MKRMGWTIASTLALALGGCSSAPEPIPIAGAPADIARMAGEWGGEYQAANTGRSGSIVFQLAVGADTARGDVVMFSHQRRESRLPQQDPTVGLAIARTPAVLQIAFVQATDGGLEGRLSPYRDPDCDCILDTRFQGRIHGDVIEGTFVSQSDGSGIAQTGTWKVKRKKD
jgi:hypothetical protein